MIEGPQNGVVEPIGPNTMGAGILVPFWSDSEAILERFWGDPGAILVRFCGDSGAILGRFWGDRVGDPSRVGDPNCRKLKIGTRIFPSVPAM